MNGSGQSKTGQAKAGMRMADEDIRELPLIRGALCHHISKERDYVEKSQKRRP